MPSDGRPAGPSTSGWSGSKGWWPMSGPKQQLGLPPPPCSVKAGYTRSDWDAHREDVRRTNKARRLAVDELIRDYPEEYDRLYAQCAEAEGVYPMERRCASPRPPEEEQAVLEARIAWLQRELARLSKLEQRPDQGGH